MSINRRRPPPGLAPRPWHGRASRRRAPARRPAGVARLGRPPEGHAHAGTDLKRSLARQQIERLLGRGHHLLGHRHRVGLVAQAVERDGEFVAAQAAMVSLGRTSARKRLAKALSSWSPTAWPC
jgi:hypothetical protein